jgi:hypothetical protein
VQSLTSNIYIYIVCYEKIFDVWVITSRLQDITITQKELEGENRDKCCDKFIIKSSHHGTRVTNDINISFTELVIPEMFMSSLCVRTHPASH